MTPSQPPAGEPAPSAITPETGSGAGPAPSGAGRRWSLLALGPVAGLVLALLLPSSLAWS